MNGRRALEIFESFRKNQLAFTSKEIDELLKSQLVVEADGRDVAQIQWLEPIVMEYAKTTFEDPSAAPTLAKELGDVDEKLKSSWSRLTTRDSKVKEQETARRNLRRALAIANDKFLVAKLAGTRNAMKSAATQLLKCQALGDELYALTHKGVRVHQQLGLRADRYNEHPLSAFMKQFDKTDAKMAAFGGEIATLSNNIGHVKKNPHQVVIGLAKTGMPADQALNQYKTSARGVTPDVAVTYARNAQQHGGAQGVANKLNQAVAMLQKCGFPLTPEVQGAAKSLLPYDNLTEAATRFVAIANAVLGAGYTQQNLPLSIKCTARLMSAQGTPAEVVRRANLAAIALNKNGIKLAPNDFGMYATALGSMVREDTAVDQIVIRFKFLWAELAKAGVHHPQANALECIGCAGTPVEVVDTVRTLAYQVAQKGGRGEPSSADWAVAASFAKRFAF